MNQQSLNNNASMLGVKVGSGSLESIVESSLEKIEAKTHAATFVCANPHSLVISKRDKAFRSALNNADYSVADGVGIILAGKVLNLDPGPRIAGNDYFDALMSTLNRRKGGRVFFFGSSERVLSLITENFRSDYPYIELCGTLSPPFGNWSTVENEKMLEIINSAKPDVLWIGMTAPKQEKWAEENREKLDVHIIGSIGAVFDFYAGTYERAPEWASKLGIEWLVRLLKEPKRMWRRTFISTPKFLCDVAIQKFKNTQ